MSLTLGVVLSFHNQNGVLRVTYPKQDGGGRQVRVDCGKGSNLRTRSERPLGTADGSRELLVDVAEGLDSTLLTSSLSSFSVR
jgi:hypothetical protein